MMANNLQPSVIKSQQLISVLKNITIGCMKYTDQKLAFAERFNELCDDAQVPPKGKNRQTIVAKLFDVSQEGARKWLEGEAVPVYDTLVRICREWNVNIEWLYRGVGLKRVSYNVAPHTPEEQVLKIMQQMSEADKYKLLKIGATLAEPEDNGDSPAAANK